MRLYICVQSYNDIITNSSTELLSIRTTYTPEILKEIILNYALLHDYDSEPCEDEVDIVEISVKEKAFELFGDTVTQEELEKLELLLCKKFNIDPSKWKGTLYRIDIERSWYETIEFLQTKLGAV